MKLKVKLDKVGDDIVRQFKDAVPVRTGRLKNSIQYNIEELPNGYILEIVMEDYFAWLKERTRPQTLPTIKELDMARPPLPKMNELGKVDINDLSPFARSIIRGIDVEDSLKSKIDLSDIIKEIKKLFT